MDVGKHGGSRPVVPRPRDALDDPAHHPLRVSKFTKIKTFQKNLGPPVKEHHRFNDHTIHQGNTLR